MIKTYIARVNNNNISYMLQGKTGNQVRYPFTNGNVITNKYPSLTLRNRYYQELLESSLLFSNNTVVLQHEEEEFPGEKAKLEAEKNEPAPESTPERVPNPTHSGGNDVIEVASVVSESDLLAFVNEKDNREGARMFKIPTNALDWATKHNYSFPNYKP